MGKNNDGTTIKPISITKKDSTSGSYTRSERIAPKQPGSGGGGKSGNK